MPENQEKFNINDLEQKVLKFWQDNKIFEKSLRQAQGKLLKKKAPLGDYVFFDGPPFATGLPHYGHILASIIKDAIPRYQTMKGRIVPRRWGWDCHGLPIENEIEKKLGLKTKKDIENIGIGTFNESARENVLQYAGEWKKIIPRIGRWVDMKNDYKTMDWTYTESVWWVFKKLFDKGLIYEGYKPIHLCPRCETTLANFEVSQGYKDITDISVIAKFELIDEPNTFVLAWTTTPWTLPGNAALAINQNLIYCKIKTQNSKLKITTQNSKISEEGYFILVKDRLGILDNEWEYKIIEEFKGKDLIGKKYKPLFDYYSKDKNLKNRENGWEIYGADFVTDEEGTGIVHIAPAFGEDDMKMAQKYGLPFIQHVSMDGKFKAEVRDFAGMPVKPKEDHQKTDIEIIKWLAANNKLFSKQKIIHSYPHCWRCDTPLLNYAASSWFVKVAAIKNKLIANNKKTNWIPTHIKNGRFGKWLADARDWAISRSRFWGAPIAVWRCQTAQNQKSKIPRIRAKLGTGHGKSQKSCGKQIVIGSLEELKKYAKKSGNKYFLMRHGEAVHNVENKVSSKLETNHNSPLTEKGKKEVEKAAEKLKNIDIIFSSDFLRAKETAEITAKALSYAQSKIIFDERIREVNAGIFDNKTPKEYHNYFSSLEEKFYKNPPEGENLIELKNRVAEFLYEIEKKYKNKNILIVSHEYPIWLMFGAAIGADAKKSSEMKKEKGDDFIKTAELRELDFALIPHNKNYELDLHKPYIDEVKFPCECGGEYKRINDVFDCWFESGSMPYGQIHYPFDKKSKASPVPAEFIAEGLDQTRGWFYTLLVLSTALFNKPAYKNVVVNGIILAEDGQKISKRLKNYPDPMEIVNKYGADALRLYLLSSPAVRGENLNFSEKGVDEVYKKTILRLWNVYKFYEIYADKKKSDVNPPARQLAGGQMSNVLDQWIIARLNQLIVEVSKAMDKYELDKAARPIADFVDDLSTWYIRRSRERFKEWGKDKNGAMATTQFILSEFSKIVAPFAPFMTEKVYQNLGNKNSVHLAEWPKADKKAIDKKLLKAMIETRKICSLGLEARQKAGIKVRQPLAELRIKNLELRNKKELLELIKDELNVREIVFDKNIASDVELDTKITAELKAEGRFREFTRAIQDLRKKAGLKPEQKIILEIQTNAIAEEFVKKFENEIKNLIGVKKIEFKKFIDGENIKIDELEFKIEIRK